MLRGVFQNAAQNFLVPLKQLIETAPTALVRGNWILFQPPAAGILIKVLAGVHGPIDRPKVQAAGLSKNGRSRQDT
jgi:hypothetical protein